MSSASSRLANASAGARKVDVNRILAQLVRYPSRFWTAVEAAVIIFALCFASWFIFYLCLGLVAFELGVRVYSIATTQNVGKYANPKTVVITGASSGIGEKLALQYAKTGVANLYLTGRSQARLDPIVKACVAAAGNKINVQAKIVDVVDRAGMATTLQDIDKKTPVDLVIANAGIGIATVDKSLDFEDQVRSIFDTNINGVLNTIFPLIPSFKSRRSGQICVISSIAGYVSLPNAYHYSASKSCVATLTQGLRGELAAFNVGVTNVAPGFVRSQLTEERHNKLRFGLPFFMEGDVAAKRIATALEDDVGTYIFPAPMHFASAGLARLLPLHLQDFVYGLLGKYTKIGKME